MRTGSTPLAVDIETVGLDWNAIHPSVQTYLLDRAPDEVARKAVPERLGLHPGTGRIVAIGLWRPEEDRGGVLVQGVGPGAWQPFEDGARLYTGSEEAILEEFWRYVANAAGTIITFNGRSFDGPFLMIRSTILGIAPTRNLVPYRYSFQDHCDLAEVLTFFRANPLYRFDFWCRQFDIASPKDEMDGGQVAEAFERGETDRIARYCLRDARSTAQLYERLRPLIAVLQGKSGP